MPTINTRPVPIRTLQGPERTTAEKIDSSKVGVPDAQISLEEIDSFSAVQTAAQGVVDLQGGTPSPEDVAALRGKVVSWTESESDAALAFGRAMQSAVTNGVSPAEQRSLVQEFQKLPLTDQRFALERMLAESRLSGTYLECAAHAPAAQISRYGFERGIRQTSINGINDDERSKMVDAFKRLKPEDQPAALAELLKGHGLSGLYNACSPHAAPGGQVPLDAFQTGVRHAGINQIRDQDERPMLLDAFTRLSADDQSRALETVLCTHNRTQLFGECALLAPLAPMSVEAFKRGVSIYAINGFNAEEQRNLLEAFGRIPADQRWSALAAVPAGGEAARLRAQCVERLPPPSSPE
jgi:hypothetical protein